MSDSTSDSRHGDPGGRPFRVVVLGYLVRGPMGGLAWHHLQYAAGLDRLGHEVLFVEDSDDYPACVHMDGRAVDTDPEEGLAFAGRAFDGLGLGDRWAYHDAHVQRWRGPAAERAEAFCRSADVVLNVSGINPLRDWWAQVPVRVLIDTDPVFVQVRHLHSDAARAYAAGHNAFFTFAEKLGHDDCAIPDDGLPWRPTRQPVVLDAWPVEPPPSHAPFTTIMQWDSYRDVEHAGVVYGMKSRAFEPYFDLPQRTTVPLEMAIGGAAKPPRQKLGDAGWRVRNPIEFTRDPWDYQRYILASGGEFSIAKHAYVASRSGWFSERSANYLAAGRPVVVQDTGFSDVLPTGEGLLAFNTPDEAVEMLERVSRDLSRHAAAAQRIAAASFDARQVLTRLLDEAVEATGASPRAAGRK
ncbi:MAG: hypothetical protein ACODAQ_00835 [Phycisphaeraceae bacterium]